MIDVWSFVISNMMNMFAMLDLWLILKLLFGCDMKITQRNLVWAAVGFLALFGVMTFCLEAEQTFFIFLGMCAYNMLVTLILTNSHRVKTVLLTIPAALVYSQFSLFMDLVGRLTGLERVIVGSAEQQPISLIDCISDVSLFLLLMLLGKIKLGKLRSVQLTTMEGILVSVFCAFSPVMIFGFEWFEQMADNALFNVTWVLFVIILNIAVVYAIAHRKKATYYRLLSEDYKKEFEAEYSFFKDYKEKQKDTIKFRHDWRNHMLLLQEMLRNDEYEKAENYFKELTATTSNPSQTIATGNEVVDMILSMKMNVLEQLEIALLCKGDFSKFDFMSYVDCCILLSNLLDNAIEANEKVQGKRYISLRTKSTDGMFYLEIKNPMEGELQLEKGRIMTTKNEKEYHGIGLQNVRDMLERYKGEYHIMTEKNEYIIQMVFFV